MVCLIPADRVPIRFVHFAVWCARFAHFATGGKFDATWGKSEANTLPLLTKLCPKSNVVRFWSLIAPIGSIRSQFVLYCPKSAQKWRLCYTLVSITAIRARAHAQGARSGAPVGLPSMGPRPAGRGRIRPIAAEQAGSRFNGAAPCRARNACACMPAPFPLHLITIPSLY